MNEISTYRDEQLLELIRQDDERAFEALFDRYWETAHCITYSKVRSAEATEEIVHELFLDFWERRHSLRISTSFAQYLRGAIKFRTISYFRQQLTKRRSMEDYLRQLNPDTAETEQAVNYNELITALEAGVKNLPERTQEVFRLNRLEGQSVREIATKMNLSEKAIEYHITRSRKELRLFLKDFLIIFCIATLT